MSVPSGNGTDPQELARKIAAQAVYERPLAKRFYKNVELVEDVGGYSLALDGRPVKTPLKRPLTMPTKALADRVAGEWEAQEEHINPANMLLTKLCNTALDRVGEGRARIVDEIVDYANSDLLCYRAEGPVELVARQSKQWDPVIDWAAEALGARFSPTAGIVHQHQSEVCLGAFRLFVDGLDDFTVAGFHNVMTLTGSAILAAAAKAQHLPGDQIWSLAHLDEDWQIEQWGEDAEEQSRRKGRQEEFVAMLEFLSLLE
ncbi:MAG: ATP12 family protein [Pseudomonadota bacterium]